MKSSDAMPFWDWRRSTPEPAPQPATAVLVTPSRSLPAATASAAAAASPGLYPAVAGPPVSKREQVPEVPHAFSKLMAMDEKQLQDLQGGALLLDDWLTETHLVVQTSLGRATGVREENCVLAQKIMKHQTEFEEIASRCRQSHEVMQQQRAPFEVLVRRKAALLAQRSPQLLAKELARRAEEVDQAAEDLLEKVLQPSGPMDAQAMADFRKTFTEQKAGKHWRLALKQGVENGRVSL